MPIGDRFQSIALNLLRMMSGFLCLQHGAPKLFDSFFGDGTGTQELASLMGIAGILEVAGGLAILFGCFTQAVAFLLLVEMGTVYFLVHFPRGFWPTLNQGEVAALYAVVFLFLAVNGGGKFSLDALIEKSEPK